jgi:hypothetical protein
VNGTTYILDTAAKPFQQYAWDNRDILSCAPCIDLAPGTNRDVFAGECKLWWSEKPDVKVCHITRFGAAFLPGQWLGPQTTAQYREQLLGGFSRLGSDAVWLDELDATFAKIGMYPDLAYLSTEDQSQCFELPNDHPTWAYIDGLTGDKRLPRNLRYTTAYGLKKITSLAAWLQTRTPYVKSCWYAFFNPVQWGQMRVCWEQSGLGHIPVCSWNQPNYSWTDPATWEKETANAIGDVVHLPMYDSSREWISRYRAILEHLEGDVVAHVRPDGDFVEQLKLLDEFDVPIALVFCDPTRLEQWKVGIGPMVDQIRMMREE